MFKKTKILAVTLAAMAFAATAFAAPTARDYMNSARKYVPAGAVMQGYDADKNEVEIKYFDNDTFLRYEVELVAGTAQVKEVTIKGATTAKSPSVVMTEADIRNAILKEYPNARNIMIKLYKEGNYYEYGAEFATPEFLVEAEINPVTAAFTEREHKYPVAK